MQFCMAISVDYTVYNFQVRTLAARQHDATCGNCADANCCACKCVQIAYNERRWFLQKRYSQFDKLDNIVRPLSPHALCRLASPVSACCVSSCVRACACVRVRVRGRGRGRGRGRRHGRGRGRGRGRVRVRVRAPPARSVAAHAKFIYEPVCVCVLGGG